MAGGIFPGQPFTLNIKCIIFALLCMGLFLIKPEEVPVRKEFSLFIIFVVAYVAMAWYDYYYNCQLMPFERGTSSVTAKLKPEEQESLCGLEKHRYHMMIYAAHLFFIVPLLAYFYYKKGKVSDRMYGMLGALVVFTFLYHAYKMLYSGKSEKSESESY
tara:strand:+ start:165 stop:641 length:477 start_codon:yes stop_codon:yes gene_type:complete